MTIIKNQNQENQDKKENIFLRQKNHQENILQVQYMTLLMEESLMHS